MYGLVGKGNDLIVMGLLVYCVLDVIYHAMNIISI